jgi:2-phosphosulfolactate phosphatase
MSDDVAVRCRQLGITEVPRLVDEPVVVIDVLRAFTTAPWVFERGATSLLLASSPTEALALKSRLGPTAIALTDGAPLPGFDLTNSPAQVSRHTLSGRTVVQSTANGTLGVHAARHAPLILCASLVNATATARVLLSSGAECVSYVITGHDGTAEEDIACADLIQAITMGRNPPSDTLERVNNSAAAQGLLRGLAARFPGVDEDDLLLACEIDRFDFALVATQKDGLVEVRQAKGEDH